MKTVTGIFTTISSLFGGKQTTDGNNDYAFKRVVEGFVADINEGRQIVKIGDVLYNGNQCVKVTFSQGFTRLINRSHVDLKIKNELFYYDIIITHEDKTTIFRFAKDIVVPRNVKIISADLDPVNDEFCDIAISVDPCGALAGSLDRTNVYLNFSDKFRLVNPLHPDLMLACERVRPVDDREGEYLLSFRTSNIPYFRYWNNDESDSESESESITVAEMFDVVLAYPSRMSDLNTIFEQDATENHCEYAYVESTNSTGFINNIIEVVSSDYSYSESVFNGSVEINTKLFPGYANQILSMDTECFVVEHYDYSDARKTDIDDAQLRSLFSFSYDAFDGSSPQIGWSIAPDKAAMLEMCDFNVGDYLKIGIKAAATDKRGTRFDAEKTVCIRYIDTATTGILKEWKLYLPTETITTLIDESFDVSNCIRDNMLKAWGFPVFAKIYIRAVSTYKTFALEAPLTIIADNPMVSVDINEVDNRLTVALDNRIAFDGMSQGLLFSFQVDGIPVEAKLTYDLKLPVVTAKYARPAAGYNTPSSSINMPTYAIYYIPAPDDTAVSVSNVLDTKYIELSADADMSGEPIPEYTYADFSDPDLLGGNACGYVSQTKSWGNTSTSTVLCVIDNVYVKLSSGQLLPLTHIKRDNGVLLVNNAGKIHIDVRPDMLSGIATDPITGGIGKMYVFSRMAAGVAVDEILVYTMFVSSTTPTLGYSNICRDSRLAEIEFIPAGISVASIASDELKASLEEIKSLGINDLVRFRSDCKSVFMYGLHDRNIPSWRGNIIQSVDIVVTDNWGRKQTSTARLLIINRPE